MLSIGSVIRRDGEPRGDQQRYQSETSKCFQSAATTVARFPSKSRRLKSPGLPALEQITNSNNGDEVNAAPFRQAAVSVRKCRQTLDSRFPGVGSETSAIYARVDGSKQRLTPLPQRSKLQLLGHEAVAVAEEQARISSTMAVAMQRMEAQIPLSFLIRSRHLDVAERVALRAMCQVLRRHYTRVLRAVFARWIQRTVTLRVLEQLAQQEVLSRQAALAHACAIVRRKVNLRLLSTMRVWHQDTLRLRAIEHDANARVLQRIWRRYSLLTRFQRLAASYRERHRYQAAAKIQSIVRMRLAKARWRELVHQRRRMLAASCMQTCYRNYQIRRIAWKQRRIRAATQIERVYRGFAGRKVSKRRRQRCQEAVMTVINSVWIPIALFRVVRTRLSALSIQRWFRACRLCWRINICMAILHRRRRFLPVWKIQQAWKRYRESQIQLVVAAATTTVESLFESGAASIQRAFRTYMSHKKAVCATRLVKLFRYFYAKRVVASIQIQWLECYTSTKITRWLKATSAFSVWKAQLLAHWQHIDIVRADQRSSSRRLQVRFIFRLMAKMKKFEAAFNNSHATQIQLRWRWHRFLALITTLKAATFLLQRTIPPLFRLFKQRRRRQRVLTRWKRARYVCLRNAFAQWKSEHLFLAHTRDLERARNKVQKSKWFRHLKLRKRMLACWREYVVCRHIKADRLTSASEWHKKRLVGSTFRAWVYDAMPVLVPQNMVKEHVLVLEAWHKLQLHMKKRRRWKIAVGWRNQRVLHRVWSAWWNDLVAFRTGIARAAQLSSSKLVHRAFLAWHNRCQLVRAVETFRVHHACKRATQQWVFHMCTVLQATAWAFETKRFRTRQLCLQHWRLWQAYVKKRRAHRRTLAEMDKHRVGVRKKQVINRWRQFTPILQDIKVTTSMARHFNEFRIKQHVFRRGFAPFWAITAGAKRVAMAIRIQRAFRIKRARTRLFILRTKIQYQIDSRVSRGSDVMIFSGEGLMGRLRQSKRDSRDMWTFVLLYVPWKPIAEQTRQLFNRVATNWTYLRKQRMCFACVDATDAVEHRICAALQDQEDEMDSGVYSLVSVLGLDTSRLPAILGFWLGSGHGVANSPVVGYSDGGAAIMKRRHERVCGDSRRKKLTLDVQGAYKVVDVMQWIENLIDQSQVATTIDLQAYARGFLARRHFKRLRVLHKEKLAHRIREWIATLQLKWYTRKINRAALRIQQFVRGVHARRIFWLRLRDSLEKYRAAAKRVQRKYRQHMLFKRLREAMLRRRASPQHFPNAPLCNECLGIDSKAWLDDSSVKLILASISCRDCRQAFCEDCASKLHTGGKRTRHLFHTIEVSAMNHLGCIMCSTCEVAQAVRACQSCCQKPPNPLTPDSAISGSEIVTCRACFELRHCKPPTRIAKLGSQRWMWWQADDFCRHKWRFVRSDRDLETLTGVATSRSVIAKYGWMTFKRLEDWRTEQQTTIQSRKAREDELYALRVQHEAILRDAFDRYDADKSGAIDRNELRRMFREELCQPLSESQLEDALQVLDRSGDGKIEFDELLAWFTEGLLDKKPDESDEGGSAALLKEALKAKRQMRRYKERLLGALPASPLEVLGRKQAFDDTLMGSPPPRAKVPGYASIGSLEASDFGAKRRVFFRFMHEICGLDWVLEDENVIPIADAMDVFSQVFLPRWNSGQLTHDFYYDGECFEFEGLQYERRWDGTKQKFGFHTRRKRVVEEAPPDERKSRRGHKKSARRSLVVGGTTTASKATSEQNEIWEDTVEWIDPRRRQELWESARSAFAHADRDASGSIDRREFRRLLSAELCEPLSSAQAKRAFDTIDTDGSGAIDFDEFFDWYATLKSQDVQESRQKERLRALLKTKRRAKKLAETAVETALTSGTAVKESIEKTLLEQQIAREKSRGASPELLKLMAEGHAKALAFKALTLHNQDEARARQWLEEKRAEQDQEQETKAATARGKKERSKQAQLKRRKTIAAARNRLALLLMTRSKKDKRAHTARLQDAVANLDHEIRMVERQATLRHAKAQRF